MARKEFIDLVSEIRTTGKGKKMTVRNFLWLFDFYEKRTSGNVWRINDFLNKEKLVVCPHYQNAWIDGEIEIKEKDKAKIKSGEESVESFDPISRLSILKASSKTPISIKRDDKLEKAYHLMWHNGISQLPVMNDERTVIGIVNWQTLAKGLIAKKESTCVKDFISNKFTVLEEDTPLFEAIKVVLQMGIVFVKDSEKKIKGPITRYDLNAEFLEQIEPFILLEQIENFIRLILNDKIILEEIQKILTTEERERNIESISDMTFGEYIRILENGECWNTIALPFDKSEFIRTLDMVRSIRNAVMHFHPDRTSKTDLIFLRKTSKFLEDYLITK